MKRMVRLASAIDLASGFKLHTSKTVQSLRRKAAKPSFLSHYSRLSFTELDEQSQQAQVFQSIFSFFRCLAGSAWFSLLTTLLTFYALFGDDLRLLFSRKPADEIFDRVTIAAMAIFGIEILVCSIGKAGYIFGFFFFLDIMSTVTLVLDITWVSEACFGDSVSDADVGKRTSGAAGDDDSAEAARAARMSRAGTKAGRVVRLIRLMRLIRLVKVFKKGNTAGYQRVESPGADWDEDEYRAIEKESAVSKKLSEMTTRRVIMLVLSIMLTLPFFQADMYKDKLPNSAQYGVDTIYRRFRDDVHKYDLASSQAKAQGYYDSLDRENYVEDFMMTVYYHNWFCLLEKVPNDKTASPDSSFGRLFWLGGSPPDSPEAAYFMPARNRTIMPDVNVNARYNGSQWNYFQCNLPEKVLSILSRPWSAATHCLSGMIAGFSLIAAHETETDVKCPSDLRYQERIVVTPAIIHKDDVHNFSFMFVFDRRYGSKMEAALNLAQTMFICLLLGVGAMTFSKDANTLVLTPIERMISKLEKIRRDPIAAMSIGDEEQHREQWAAMKKKKTDMLFMRDAKMATANSIDYARLQPRSWWIIDKFKKCKARCQAVVVKCCRASTKNTPEPMETLVLEKTIIKIGSLLALGFGEAGAEIIGQNMKGGDSSALNAMIPGRKVEAIFGFCDIRHFTETTEVLEDQVMVFVNRIAGVVHSCIHEFFGSPNQNIGDAFLLVWRLSGHDPDKQRRLADMSVISFMKIIAQTNKSPLLAEYRSHTKLLKRLPNYRVRMGFGLHSGWAIEGAIGSEFKIDASYLSPNVNMASRLEQVTKHYGSSIIISHVLVQLMSERIAQQARLIDYVLMIGLDSPLKLYTMDLDETGIEIQPVIAKVVSKSAKFKHRLENQRKRQERWLDDFDMETFFESDEDITKLRERYTAEFSCRFNMAYLNYEAGNWPVAQDMLQVTKTLLGGPDDGPSAALLQYMASNTEQGQAPKSWRGYRVELD